MKKLTCYMLCAALLAAVALSGCAERSAAPEAPSGETSSIEQTESLPEESSAPEPVSSAPEKNYPLPELAGQDKMLIENDIDFFVANLSADPITATDELEPGGVLWCVLVNLYRQKDVNAYYFESDGNGRYFIPADLVAEEAERLFGLEGFSDTASDYYDAEKNAYGYNAAHDGNILSNKLGTLKGTESGGISCDVSFYDPDTGDEKREPLMTRRYVFNLGRINGMPYLQLVSIEDVTPAA